MAKQVPFHITSGLPFGKSIVVTLPTGRGWWTARPQFEVLCQVREAPDEASPLLLDLAQFMDVAFTAPDTVTIDLNMSGSETRFLRQSGYYDIIISDPLPTDVRAIRVLDGPVYRTTVTTADTEKIT